MASSAGSIIANLATTAAAATGIQQVDTWPLLAEDWAEQYRAAAGRQTAVHVGIVESDAETAYTDGTFGERLRVRLSVIFPYSGTNYTQLITLRDALLDSVCSTANLERGGYATTTDWTGWGLDFQSSEICGFHVDLAVLHTWARA